MLGSAHYITFLWLNFFLMHLLHLMHNLTHLYLFAMCTVGARTLSRYCSSRPKSGKLFIRWAFKHQIIRFANACFQIDFWPKPFLSDFGLSNFFDPSKLLGTFCGSPVYSAPELIEGKKYIGPEVDAWSLGINVYAMIVGDLPFADSNLAALYDSIIKGQYNIPDFVPDGKISWWIEEKTVYDYLNSL